MPNTQPKRIRTNMHREIETQGFKKFKQFKAVYSDHECNQLLSQGFELLSTGISHVDGLGYNAKPTFILAK